MIKESVAYVYATFLSPITCDGESVYINFNYLGFLYCLFDRNLDGEKTCVVFLYNNRFDLD